MSDGIYIMLGLAVIVVVGIILIRRAVPHKTSKIQDALRDLYELPLSEWEEKWAEFVQKEYNKCNDPRRQEVEDDMEFFHKELEKLKKGEQDEREATQVQD